MEKDLKRETISYIDEVFEQAEGRTAIQTEAIFKEALESIKRSCKRDEIIENSAYEPKDLYWALDKAYRGYGSLRFIVDFNNGECDRETEDFVLGLEIIFKALNIMINLMDKDMEGEEDAK